MKLKKIILVPLITGISMIILNGLFHAIIMSSFFDSAFSRFGDHVRPIKETNPALLAIVELTWVSALFYFISTVDKNRTTLSRAIIGGMFLNAVACGTWNFINLSMFSVYPASVILPDLAWHILIIGPLAGIIMSFLYNKIKA